MIVVGDAVELPLRTGSVQTVVTSPPYWGLRQYAGDQSFLWPNPDGTEWEGALGLEPTPELYVAHLTQVFAEVWRVLRDDGTLWVNLGDGYAASGYSRQDNTGGAKRVDGGKQKHSPVPMGLKSKDLIGIPWRVAFALQAAGWYLRSDIIWAKPNPMPESVRDRPTRSHEYVFLLTKSPRYYYDAAAIAEPVAASTLQQVRDGYTGQATKDYATGQAQDPSATKSRIIEGLRRKNEQSGDRRKEGFNDRWDAKTSVDLTRNARSVWTINPQPYPEAHFATFPTELARRCIAAGSKPGDLVLDPFGGSGTTARVAELLGRQGLSVDVSLEYARLAKARCQQPVLFSAPCGLPSPTPPSTPTTPLLENKGNLLIN